MCLGEQWRSDVRVSIKSRKAHYTSSEEKSYRQDKTQTAQIYIRCCVEQWCIWEKKNHRAAQEDVTQCISHEWQCRGKPRRRAALGSLGTAAGRGRSTVFLLQTRLRYSAWSCWRGGTGLVPQLLVWLLRSL